MTSLSWSVGAVDTVPVTFKVTEQVEQQICIKFSLNPKHSTAETIWMIQKAADMGNLWFTASTQQCTHSCITSHAVFWQNVKSPRWLGPLQPRFGNLGLLAFPKTKITFKREGISDHRRDSGKYNRAADSYWENCVRSQGATLKRTEASLSCVQCFLYLVSSSRNVSSFHSARLDTFWTDRVYYLQKTYFRSNKYTGIESKGIEKGSTCK